MANKQFNPYRFWQELKRRKVIRSTIAYLASAFIILEGTNNISDPLNLPEWLPKLVIILFAIGLPITIIFSWIFDFTPEGIKKTEPQKAMKGEIQPEHARSAAIMILILMKG